MVKYCKISKYKQQKLQDLFLAGVSARKAAEIVMVHRNSATRFFKKLRILISENTNKEEKLSGEVEVDECYIGKQRKGKPSRSVEGKFVIIGAKQRNGKIRASIIKDTSLNSVKYFKKRISQIKSSLYKWPLSYNNLDYMEYIYYIVYYNK